MILPQISCPTVPESARLHSLNGGCQNGKVGARVIHCHPLDCQAHPWNPLGRHFTKSKEVQVDSKEIGLENCRVWWLLEITRTLFGQLPSSRIWPCRPWGVLSESACQHLRGLRTRTCGKHPWMESVGQEEARGGLQRQATIPIASKRASCWHCYTGPNLEVHSGGMCLPTPSSNLLGQPILALKLCKRHDSVSLQRFPLCGCNEPRSLATTMPPANSISSTKLGGELGCFAGGSFLRGLNTQLFLFGKTWNWDDTGASWVSCTTWKNRFVENKRSLKSHLVLAWFSLNLNFARFFHDTSFFLVGSIPVFFWLVFPTKEYTVMGSNCFGSTVVKFQILFDLAISRWVKSPQLVLQNSFTVQDLSPGNNKNWAILLAEGCSPVN